MHVVQGGKDAEAAAESSRAYAACQWHLAPPALSTQVRLPFSAQKQNSMLLCRVGASLNATAARAYFAHTCLWLYTLCHVVQLQSMQGRGVCLQACTTLLLDFTSLLIWLYIVDRMLIWLSSCTAVTQPRCDSACRVDQDLGWGLSDSEALCAPSASPAADAVTAGSKGKPVSVTKKQPTADKTATAAAVGQAAPMTDEIVNGFQTPCHVAAIQCHKAAVEQLKANLTAAISSLKDSMYAWQQHETANKERWAACLKKMYDVV